jgi:hypothetical protein
MRVLNNTMHAISVTFVLASAQSMRKGVRHTSILLLPGVTELDVKLGTSSAEAQLILDRSPDFQRHLRDGRFVHLSDAEPQAPAQEVVDKQAVLSTIVSLDDLLGAVKTEEVKAPAAQATASTPASVAVKKKADDDEEIDKKISRDVPTMDWTIEKLRVQATARGIATEGLSKTQLVRALRQA